MATAGGFHTGLKLFLACGGLAVFISVILALGTRFGQTPTHGQALGRVQKARIARWVLLAIAVVGLFLMMV